MKIQNKTIKKICNGVCAFLLSFAIIISDTYIVNATEYETEVSLPKLTDIILTKQGVVANTSTLDNISNALVNKMQNEVERVYNGMVEAGETTWDNVANYIGECIEDFRIEKPVTAFIESVKENGFFLPMVTAYDVATSLSPNEHGGGGRRRGDTYIIDDEVTDMVSDTFSNWWSENSGYYIYRVPAFTEIPASYFTNTNTYNITKQLVSLTSDCDFIHISPSSNMLYVRTPSDDAMYYVTDTSYTPADSDFEISQAVSWSQVAFSGWRDNETTSKLYIDCDYIASNYETLSFDNISVITDSYWAPKYTAVKACKHSGSNHSFIVSNVAKNIKIFKSLEGGKSYDAGQQMVYFSPSYTNVTVNSVSYTGDYYCDNSSIYSYSIVQNSIDNSTEETITDSIIDSIVDESTTTIINNYYYTSDSGDGSGDSSEDGSGDSSGDSSEDGGLDVFFSGLTDLVEFLLNLLGQVVSIITGLGNGLINLITPLTSLFSGFTGLLGSVFTFVPQEIMDCLTAGFSAIVLIAVWNKFSGGKS